MANTENVDMQMHQHDNDQLSLGSTTIMQKWLSNTEKVKTFIETSFPDNIAKRNYLLAYLTRYKRLKMQTCI